MPERCRADHYMPPQRHSLQESARIERAKTKMLNDRLHIAAYAGRPSDTGSRLAGDPDTQQSMVCKAYRLYGQTVMKRKA